MLHQVGGERYDGEVLLRSRREELEELLGYAPAFKVVRRMAQAREELRQVRGGGRRQGARGGRRRRGVTCSHCITCSHHLLGLCLCTLPSSQAGPPRMQIALDDSSDPAEATAWLMCAGCGGLRCPHCRARCRRCACPAVLITPPLSRARSPQGGV